MGDSSDEHFQEENLRRRILNIIKSSKDFTIRPGRLSHELGISIDDATSELCGLLKVVGEGSTFKFEDIDGTMTMVFTFPPDFEKIALAQEKKEDVAVIAKNALEFFIRAVKIVTAFGIVISTFIVSLAGIAAMVAALVALSRGGGGGDRHLRRQLQNLIITIRQLLWCYVMFGGPTNDDQDPFFRDAAYDSWLVLSLCCGDPRSFWFWLRARSLQQRRRRYARGWGNNNNTSNDTSNDTDSNLLEGVSLIQRGEWGNETIPIPTSSFDEHKGFLSVAVEYLFHSNSKSPSEEEKWRLRGAVIVDLSVGKSGPISLELLSPFVDNPPSGLDATASIVSECLLIVSYFNGKPAGKILDEGQDTTKARFVFPELVSEGRFSTNYSGPVDADNTDRHIFDGIFYAKERQRILSSINDRPAYLHENFKVLTVLTRKQFLQINLVAVLNFLGVVWFAQSLEQGGILQQSLGPSFVLVLQRTLIPVLLFYAKLFFCIPAARLFYIVGWNWFCKQRNQRRRQLATDLSR